MVLKRAWVMLRQPSAVSKAKCTVLEEGVEDPSNEMIFHKLTPKFSYPQWTFFFNEIILNAVTPK